jgi:GGDEF domain-containing protein
MSFMRSTADFGPNIIATIDIITGLVGDFAFAHDIQRFWEKNETSRQMFKLSMLDTAWHLATFIHLSEDCIL